MRTETDKRTEGRTDGRTVAFRNNVQAPKNSTLYPAIISPLFFCVVGKSSKVLCAIYMANGGKSATI
jgi:hypothetical protein